MSDGDLYRSDELVVRPAIGFSNRCLVLSFDSFNDGAGLDRPGFGETFFRNLGIDAIHFIERGNTWYQKPDTPTACEIVAKIAAGYERVVSYGSSMGGYGAARFGPLCGATEALLFSPQFSIDAKLIGFDGRLAAFPNLLVRYEGLTARLPTTCYIVYDPIGWDGGHVKLYRKATSVKALGLPRVGHSAIGFIADTQLLVPCVKDFVAGTLDMDELRLKARAVRDKSPQLAFNMSKWTLWPSRRLMLARRASELSPDNTFYRMTFGLASILAGRKQEGLAICREAWIMDKRSVRLTFNLSKAYFYAGRLDRAAVLARDVVLRSPYSQPYSLWLRWLNRWRGFLNTLFLPWKGFRRLLAAA